MPPATWGVMRRQAAQNGVVDKRRTSERSRRAWQACAQDAAQDEGETKGETKGGVRKDGHVHGVVLRRELIHMQTRNGRAGKLRRWASIGEMDIGHGDLGEDVHAQVDQRIDVWVVVQRSGDDYRVLGRASTCVSRVCDRCTRDFSAVADGRFEVLLVTGRGVDKGQSDDDDNDSGGGDDLVEAVEDFKNGVEEIDLAPHVRDAVVLGLPTRALCSDGCVGVEMGSISGGGSVRYAGEAATTDAGGNELFRGNEQLLELKRQLERNRS